MAAAPFPPTAFDAAWGSAEMAALWSPQALVAAMLAFEAALARALADAGLAPPEAAHAVAAACRPEAFDAERLVADAADAGGLALPLVRALTARVAAAAPDAARWVHHGATSQDAIDTALVLQGRHALALVQGDLATLLRALCALHAAHGHHPVMARTLMQPAGVVSLGLRLLAWAEPLARSRQALDEAAQQALVLQFGGAVGTLAALGPHAPAVTQALGRHLGLPVPPTAWHTQRDRLARLGCELGVLAGALAKLAQDLALAMQGEVGELAEPAAPGRGSSSAMPHKHNPVAVLAARAQAAQVPPLVAGLLGTMAHEHERALGAWQAEGALWARLWLAVHGSLRPLAALMPHLQVHPDRMRAHIDAQCGLLSAEPLAARLAAWMGRTEAQAWVAREAARVMEEGGTLAGRVAAAAAADPAGWAALPAADLPALFDPERLAEPARAMADAGFRRLRQALDGTPQATADSTPSTSARRGACGPNA